MMKNKLFTVILLISISIVAFGLRLYKIDSPLADHHSWRQSDSASVIRNLSVDFDFLHPRWDNLLVTNAGAIPNPNGYFFEDFPLSFDIYPAINYHFFGENITTLRISAVIFSTLTLFFLFLLIKDLANVPVALISAFLFSILPYSIFFSRGIFQENAVNLYAVISIFFLNRYLLNNRKILFLLAVIFSALLFLTKPYALVFLLPLSFLFFQKYNIGLVKKPQVYLFFFLSLLPFILWWLWVNQFPEGIPYSGWLLNEGNIRFKGAFFQWIFSDRISSLILGNFGIIFLGAGLFALNKFKDGVMYLWLVCLFIYTSVIAKGSVTHDYYQIPFIIPISYFSAKGIEFLFQLQKRFFEKGIALILILIFLLFTIAFSWYRVRDFYNLTSGIDLAGNYVNQNIPKDVLIITGDGADPTLLYNCNRKGWTIGYGSTLENHQSIIEKLIGEGARYYITTQVNQIKGTDFEKYMRKSYEILKETDQYVIFKLQEK